MSRRRKSTPHVNHERWLVSYADFITLLFAFFTMMYAVSTVDADKFKSAASSVQAAFSSAGQTEAQPSPVGALEHPDGRSMLTDPGTAGKVLENLTDVRARLDGRLTKQIDEGVVELLDDPRGLVVSMQEAGSFTTGSADLSNEAMSILTGVAESLGTIDNFVRVEGHTDDVPIRSGRFSSNWDLSTARATIVVRYLTERAGLRADRLSAAGFAEFRPRVPNDSAAGRAANRRVDLVILNPATSQAEEPRLR
ncbi:MAG: flagellar motor protein MotB [Vicinamibacterales bacterium]